VLAVRQNLEQFRLGVYLRRLWAAIRCGAFDKCDLCRLPVLFVCSMCIEALGALRTRAFFGACGYCQRGHKLWSPGRALESEYKSVRVHVLTNRSPKPVGLHLVIIYGQLRQHAQLATNVNVDDVLLRKRGSHVTLMLSVLCGSSRN
jgi:hypothetical protein